MVIFYFIDHLPSIGILWTGKMGENGQSFSRDSQVPWDQTVGSKIFTFGSLSTGSPVGPVGLTSLQGLMYSQATVTAV